ncbi:hypothetical protein FAZ69_23530 [Trinickia terrae]|uniref:Uncharacterized protein n=1 Tax=Trinickia terrae TaxID=2571161 RepID=A0A4U1HQ45_9BURK|nr:hypothetical protein [Trinickia terrae]TKC83462.1 hypothetical protein FAZ69_23530 [Trinickia terrae]
MPWDMTKCKWGTPPGFSDTDATDAVTNADFTNAVFVQTSEIDKVTKKAFTYYEVSGYRICVVGDVHTDTTGKWTIAGNSYIPGWKDWAMQTPVGQVAVIGPLKDGGTFPDKERYPHPIK